MENSPKTTCKTVLLVIFPIGIICTDLWAEAFPTANTNAEGKHCVEAFMPNPAYN